MSSSVFVSIVAYRSDRASLRWTLRGLGAQTLPPTHVRVLVNGATEAEQRDLEKDLEPHLPPDTDLEIIFRCDNLGFSGGHNFLVRRFLELDADSLLILNPDVYLDSACVAILASTSAATGDLSGPVLYRAERSDAWGTSELSDRTAKVDTAGMRWTPSGRHLDVTEPPARKEPFRVPALSGATIMAPRSAVQSIMSHENEFFDDAFFAYREDAELGLRAQWYGLNSMVVPVAFGWHIRTLRGTSRRVSPKLNMLGVQNRFLLLAKWGRHRPGPVAIGLLRDLAVVAVSLTMERNSAPGLLRAYRLRRFQRYRGRHVRRLSERTEKAPQHNLDRKPTGRDLEREPGDDG